MRAAWCTRHGTSKMSSLLFDPVWKLEGLPVDLREELRHPTPTLQDVLLFMRAAVRNALTSAIARLIAPASSTRCSTSPGASRAWRTSSYSPRIPRACCWRGRSNKVRKAGHWSSRGQQRSSTANGDPGARAPEPPMELDPAVAFERKRQPACAEFRQGELTRTRQVLTAAELAPGTNATWVALTESTKRPPDARFPPPAELLQYQPEVRPALNTCASRGPTG